MEQRVSIITLGVADLKRSQEFYERLGWRRSMANTEGIVFFQAGGMALALYPRHELAKDANVAPDGQGFSGISLAYNARTRAEVDSVLEAAVAAGAKRSSLRKKPFGAAIQDTSRILTDFSGRSPGIHPSRSRRTEVCACRTNREFHGHGSRPSIVFRSPIPSIGYPRDSKISQDINVCYVLPLTICDASTYTQSQDSPRQ